MMIVLRHSPPLEKGICAGRFELPVVDPRPQLGDLLPQLRPLQLTRIYSSPALRCGDLARPIAIALGLSLRIDERIQELHFGQWEGKHWTEVEAQDSENFEAWTKDWQNAAPPGGESIPTLECRVRAFLRELPDTSALVVTHAGVIRAMKVLSASIPWQVAMGDTIPYLQPIEITIAPSDFGSEAP